MKSGLIINWQNVDINSALFDVVEKKYHCATTGYSTKSRFKGNIVRHIKDSSQQKLRKGQTDDNKICHYCGKRFKQKSNRNRHVKSQHEDGTVDNHTDADEIVDDCVIPLTFVPGFEHDFRPGTSNHPSNAAALDCTPHQTTPEILNVSFRSNDGEINDTAMVKIEQETPIYEVFEPYLNIPFSPIRDTTDSRNNINNAEPNKWATLPNVTLEIGK